MTDQRDAPQTDPPPAAAAGSASLRPTGRSLPIALLRARETVMEPIREMLAVSRISEQKWRVLRVVEESGPLEQTAIARQASLLLPSLTRILQAMARDGLLDRATDRDDRRKSIITITAAGRALIREHAAQSNAIFARLESRFGQADLDRLLDLLERLRDVDMTVSDRVPGPRPDLAPARSRHP